MKLANTNFVKIEDAYKELSGNVFAFWVRLMMLRDHQFLGRGNLAAAVGIPLATSNKMLRELKLLDYVDYINNGPGKKTMIVLLKKAGIVGFNRFVRL